MTYTKYTFLTILLVVILSSCGKIKRFLGPKKPPTTYSSAPAPAAQKIAKWNVETTYIMEDVTPALGNRIMKEVSSKILKNPNAIRELSIEEYKEAGLDYNATFGFAIHPDEVSSISKLSSIQQVIMDFSEKEIVPLELISNVLRFKSAYGAAAAFTRIYGVAPARAIITIDDGSNEIVTSTTNEAGEWFAEVRQNPELSKRNGIVYVKIENGSVVQYLAMNILDRSQRKIVLSEIPRNSILLQ